MDIVFVNEPNFWYPTKSFVNNGVIQKKKTNDGRTTWIVQGNEKRTKNINLLNEFKKKRKFYTEWTNFPKDFEKTIVSLINVRFWKANFLKNKFFYWKNDFIKRGFNWTNDFTERSFSEKTNEININWTIILKRIKPCSSRMM